MDLHESCAKYIAFLRSLYLLHQSHHWLTNGNSSYAYHLLFERIYQSAAENADLAAEKCIGLFGNESLDVENQPSLIQEILGKYSTANNFAEKSLAAEKDFLVFSQEFYDALKSADKLSLGMDDAVMQIASKREEASYLLQQNIGTKMSKLNLVARKFQLKLAQQADPNVAYLKQTAEIAAMNLSTGTPISVNVQADATQNISEDPNIKVEQVYTVRVGGLGNDKTKLQFKQNMTNTLQAQKPELLGKINYFYL